MSINHFSSDLPEDYWWSHYTMDSPPPKTSSSPHHPHHHQKPFITNSTPQFWLTPHHNLYHNATAAAAAAPMFSHQNAAVSFDLNNEDEDEVVDEHVTDTPRESQLLDQETPKERLFEKPLTPSDVGKLNRLVIPKQHAEKHFPLNGSGDSGENCLLLGFEDEVGKSWRFRYSYWNSSQSYVLTKGWSRFVKEKRLDAGDIVIFARHRVDTGRFFIGWRRRNSGDGGVTQPTTAVANGGGSGGWNRVYYSGHHYPIQQHGPSNSLSNSPSYQHESFHSGTGLQKQTSSTGGNSKRLRLFGVNLECQADESEPLTPVGSPMSSHQQPYHHQYNYSNHMDISFSGAGDVHRQR